MKLHAVICTRSREDVTPITHNLISYLVQCDTNILLMIGTNSIFKAYKEAFSRINQNPEDIIVFCHDDIEIREKPHDFVQKLKNLFQNEGTGFVGPAGTTNLGHDAIWWEQNRWQKGLHKGKVTHLDPQGKEYLTFYGEPGDVVILDGVFLAAQVKTIEKLGLDKPEYFEGEWDFYDIHYTSKAFLEGYTNKILDMDIVHHSRGELVGRDSWHKNREAFISKTKLPLVL